MASIARTTNPDVRGGLRPMDSGGGNRPATAGVLRPPRDGERIWVSHRASVHDAAQRRWLKYNASGATFEQDNRWE